ncbi:MAG: M20/M25/M40 family metallo-hydrolase [Prochloraceae cyanobacterium]|nr:M20/M25/M40 family metallo-hydrolase [Prochloraceae cyanobacterium]
MDRNTSSVIFFDIGNTLGSPRVSPNGRLATLTVYRYVPDVLQQLHDDGKRLGIISNIGSDTAENVERVLSESEILNFFESDLRLYGPKDSPEIFRRAATQAGLSATPEQCLFVGEDSKERSYALEAGWRVVPHPILVADVLKGRHLRYTALGVSAEQANSDWQSPLRDLPIVPIHVTTDNRGTKVYASASTVTILSLDDLGFEVERLGEVDSPLRTDLYLLRDDRQVRTGFLVPEGQSAGLFSNEQESTWVISSSHEGLYIALPAMSSIDNYHFEEAYHGHNLKLIPNLSLLDALAVQGTGHFASLVAEPEVDISLKPEELAKLSSITSKMISGYLAKYSGKEPIEPPGNSKIISRHIDSDDNAKATDALARDLEAIGDGDFSVYLHPFDRPNPGNRPKLYNVVAEFPGAGNEKDGIVIVSAHFDSTANFEPNFNPEVDPAPGTDDDGSGVAGVLAIAKTLKELSLFKKHKKTICFVLFNAEEQGLVGSQEYARDEAQANAPIIAVYQLDMIGYRKEKHDIPLPFEVHVGHKNSPAVEKRSLKLAQQIEKLVPQVSPKLKSPQIYTTPDAGDPRSDHSSFQQVGYTACLVSEDLFMGPPKKVMPGVNNPNYHTARDLQVDFEYAADIARLVAAAAWMTAKQ